MLVIGWGASTSFGKKLLHFWYDNILGISQEIQFNNEKKYKLPKYYFVSEQKLKFRFYELVYLGEGIIPEIGIIPVDKQLYPGENSCSKAFGEKALAFYKQSVSETIPNQDLYKKWIESLTFKSHELINHSKISYCNINLVDYREEAIIRLVFFDHQSDSFALTFYSQSKTLLEDEKKQVSDFMTQIYLVN